MADVPEASHPDASRLRTRALTRAFGDLRAVDNVALDIQPGEFFTIVGPSGSGKSTLLRILAGLDSPTAGTVWLGDADITVVPANERPTCMVFQSLALFEHRTVGENIEFSQKMRGVSPDERRSTALGIMRTVRLSEDYYHRPVTECSGGERQRIALARALASDPAILFFDEPLSAIDYRLRKILEVEMKDLHRETGKTFVYITHSLEEAMVMSDRIAIMRDGRIVQTGTPYEIYHRPQSRFVAEFMGEVNIFNVRDGRLMEIDLPVPDVPNGELMVRPENLRKVQNATEADVAFDAVISGDYMLGSRTQFHLRANRQTLIAELPAALAVDLAARKEGIWGFDIADTSIIPETSR